MVDPIRKRMMDRLADLEKRGISARAASIAGGMSPDGVRGVLRKPDNSPTVETIIKLARGLETSPEWLAFGIGDDIAHAQEATAEMTATGLPVIGEVAAGRWLEADDHVDEPLYDPVPVQPDPRWRVEDQYGLVVRGTSINQIALDGDILACVSLAAVRQEPSKDELVIVEMRRAAGLLRQRTAKRYLPRGTHLELWPDSTDPRWQKPIIIPRGPSPLESAFEDDESRIDVAITALVTWVHRPIQRRRRS